MYSCMSANVVDVYTHGPCQSLCSGKNGDITFQKEDVIGCTERKSKQAWAESFCRIHAVGMWNWVRSHEESVKCESRVNAKSMFCMRGDDSRVDVESSWSFCDCLMRQKIKVHKHLSAVSHCVLRVLFLKMPCEDRLQAVPQAVKPQTFTGTAKLTDRSLQRRYTEHKPAGSYPSRETCLLVRLTDFD